MTTTRNQALDMERMQKELASAQETIISLKASMEQLQRTVAERPLIVRGEDERSNTHRLAKLDFPKFEGDDVEGWNYKCEHFFTIDDTPEHKKVRYAAIHMEGRALQWHQAFMRSSGKSIDEIGWDEYSRSINARFAQTMIEDAMGALKALTQTDKEDDWCSSIKREIIGTLKLALQTS